jgi:hypothetical protein
MTEQEARVATSDTVTRTEQEARVAASVLLCIWVYMSVQIVVKHKLRENKSDES